MLGRQERVLEERIERIMGGVKWGMNWESDWWGCEVVVEVRIEVIFPMIWAAFGGDSGAEFGDILEMNLGV